MSMIGEYVRLTPAELDRLIGDEQWADGFVHELIDTELDEEPEASQARCHDTDKAWDALRFLLRRAGFPVDIVHGEQSVPWDEDWGYGPPRYLTAARVQEAARALTALSPEHLVEGVAPADLAAADVYPALVWERGESLDYVAAHYEAVAVFFQAAARDGHAVLVWLD
ncbi:YfbM family protein [Streptomyces sp. V4-01]|uniref:YfbM family protein n=1 Tax=Actinacidiphila polyblastidii TaxID=3110430 RepID=A0ABU7PEY8_9ACTN|nr:YfbM family protein [Streptomyces sp. V4-01]